MRAIRNDICLYKLDLRDMVAECILRLAVAYLKCFGMSILFSIAQVTPYFS